MICAHYLSAICPIEINRRSSPLLFSIAIAYLVIYPTTFETTAQILVQDDKDTFSSGSFGLGEAAGLMKSFGLGGSSNSAINLDDEFVTITSNQLFRDMVERLGLYVDYMEPIYIWLSYV